MVVPGVLALLLVAAPPPRGIVRGHVVDADGRPVSGARVESTSIVDSLDGVEQGEATTDPTGAFEIADRAAGEVWLEAQHPRFARAAPVVVKVEPARGPTDARIVLRRGGRIVGSVRRRDGRPVPDAELRFLGDQEEPTMAVARYPPTRARADGTFEMAHVGPGPGLLLATIGPDRPAREAIGRMLELNDLETVTAHLVREQVAVSGRVTRSGAPGSGLRVVVSNTMPGEAFARIQAALFGGQMPRPASEAVTDENGEYSVAVQPGPALVSVSDTSSRTDLLSQQFEIPDEDEHTIDVVVGGAPVTGFVTDASTGAPVPEAAAGLSPAGGDPANFAGRTRSDAEGRFELEVPPGDYDLSVGLVEGYRARVVPLAVPEGGASDVQVSIEQAPAIRGRVLDADDRPVAEATVWAGDAKGRTMARGECRTDASGRFVIKDLEDEAYDLLIRSQQPSGVAFRANVRPGPDEIAIVVRSPSKVTVRAVDPQGRPVANAPVAMEAVDGHTLVWVFQVATDPRGIATLDVPAGTVQIVVRGGNQGPLEGRGTVSVASGNPSDLVIAMEPAPARAP